MEAYKDNFDGFCETVLISSVIVPLLLCAAGVLFFVCFYV